MTSFKPRTQLKEPRLYSFIITAGVLTVKTPKGEVVNIDPRIIPQVCQNVVAFDLEQAAVKIRQIESKEGVCIRHANDEAYIDFVNRYATFLEDEVKQGVSTKVELSPLETKEEYLVDLLRDTKRWKITKIKSKK